MTFRSFLNQSIDFTKKPHQGTFTKPQEKFFKISKRGDNHFIKFDHKEYEIQSALDENMKFSINKVEKISNFFNDFFNNHASIEFNKGSFKFFSVIQGQNKNIINKNKPVIIQKNINNINLDIQLDLNKNETENCTFEVQIHFIQKNPYTKLAYFSSDTILLENPLKFPDIRLIKIKRKSRFPFFFKIFKIFHKMITYLFNKTEPLTEKIARQFNHITPYYSPEIDKGLYENIQVSKEEQRFAEFLNHIDKFIDIDKTKLNKEQLIFQILTGAYVMIHDDGGLYGDWSKDFVKASSRISSHESDPEAKQYSIQGPFVGECLFSRKKIVENENSETVSWFQLERYPGNKLIYVIPHLWSYLLYKISGANQGPHGSSHYTEKNPLILHLKYFPVADYFPS